MHGAIIEKSPKACHNSGETEEVFEILQSFPFFMLWLYMQHEGRRKAAKLDENVAKWRKICRCTVINERYLKNLSETFLKGSNTQNNNGCFHNHDDEQLLLPDGDDIQAAIHWQADSLNYLCNNFNHHQLTIANSQHTRCHFSDLRL